MKFTYVYGLHTYCTHKRAERMKNNHHQPDEDKWMDCVTCPEETGLTAADFR